MKRIGISIIYESQAGADPIGSLATDKWESVPNDDRQTCDSNIWPDCMD